MGTVLGIIRVTNQLPPPLLPQCDPPLEVKDLFIDIQDGKILMALLEVLSGRNLVRMSRKGQGEIKGEGKH